MSVVHYGKSVIRKFTENDILLKNQSDIIAQVNCSQHLTCIATSVLIFSVLVILVSS